METRSCGLAQFSGLSRPLKPLRATQGPLVRAQIAHESRTTVIGTWRASRDPALTPPKFNLGPLVPIDNQYYSCSMTSGPSTSGALLREARNKSQLSQTELASRAGVAQSVISAYESGRREPAFSTLQRLISATGNRVVISLKPVGDARPGFPDTPIGRRLRQRRASMRAVGHRHGAQNLRVFGSVVRGEDRADSDLDIVADLPTGMGLFELGAMERELSEVVGMKVDLVPADGLRPKVRAEVEVEAVDL